MMNILPDFKIVPKEKIADNFLKRRITTFRQAIDYIQNLEYGRNSNKDDLNTVFTDNKGTSSTKHAVLKQLCIEHEMDEVKLFVGIFKMTAVNTPMVGERLMNNKLSHIPEAHTYLKYKGHYYDFTTKTSSPNDFVKDLLFEVEIQPTEINRNKIQLHQDYLREWLDENTEIGLSFDEIWSIREQCIMDLSK